MRSASLSLGIGCVLLVAQPVSAEGVVKQGAGAAGGAAGVMVGSTFGGPIGGAVGGVVGDVVGRGTVGVVGAIIPGGGKKKKARKAQAQAEAQARAEAPPPVLAVQTHPPAPQIDDEASDAAASVPVIEPAALDPPLIE
jgi:hypothetical protein